MSYLSSKHMAEKWGVAERTVRNYCSQGKVQGATLIGKTWGIPEDAQCPTRKHTVGKQSLLQILREEKQHSISGGIYHKIQVELTYNSNHIEGSRLTHDQTRYIYETNTIGMESEIVNVDDVVETANHFRCIDYIIDNANKMITENMMKELHFILKNGTSDSRKSWFAVGDYKKRANEVGGKATTAPENVKAQISSLLKAYNGIEEKTLDDVLDFHYRFEKIHPFQDGNGRVGRLLLFKECLKYNIVPFIIDEQLKLFYYRGLAEWTHERGYLRDTCLTAQDKFKLYLDYFRIEYENN